LRINTGLNTQHRPDVKIECCDINTPLACLERLYHVFDFLGVKSVTPVSALNALLQNHADEPGNTGKSVHHIFGAKDCSWVRFASFCSSCTGLNGGRTQSEKSKHLQMHGKAAFGNIMELFLSERRQYRSEGY
jgi:hypothetical protein